MGALRRLLGHRDRERPSDRPPSPELLPPELDELDLAIVSAAQPYTMTSRERLFALVKAVRYVVSAGVPGDIVECGVWRGGSMVAAARTLLRSDERSRHLYLFDTFEGMPPPSDDDVELSGESAAAILVRSSKDEHVWAVAPRTEVEAVMATTGYDPARVHYVQGRVEETLPAAAPQRIALLRLDTDWYESTRHELVHLYPRLSPGGVLIVDDYGHWQGARKAVDEYLAEVGEKLLLHIIDYTGRIAVKPGRLS